RLTNVIKNVLKCALATAIMAVYLYICAYVGFKGWWLLTARVLGAIAIYAFALIVLKQDIALQLLEGLKRRLKRIYKA
ncbi:MAG: hypothetical protein II920_11350, partial [Clostridia bacterium]|nr:hypothetical protein [Clostridia bacterium]